MKLDEDFNKVVKILTTTFPTLEDSVVTIFSLFVVEQMLECIICFGFTAVMKFQFWTISWPDVLNEILKIKKSLRLLSVVHDLQFSVCLYV